MKRAARAGLPAVALGALALTGCGRSSPGAPSSAPAPTVGPASASDLRAVVNSANATLRTSSDVSFRLIAAQVFGSSGKSVSGKGSFDFTSSEGRVSLQQPTGPEQLLFLPSSVFVSQAGGSSVLPSGKTWISAGLTEQSLATNFPQFVTQVESLNPALLLSEIAWGAESAAPTSTGYEVQIDLTRARVLARGPSADSFRRAIGYQITEMSGPASARLTVDVRVDRTGRITGLQGSPAGAGMGTISMALDNFGVSVAVSAPSRAEVADISSLAPGGERENAAGGDTDGA